MFDADHHVDYLMNYPMKETLSVPLKSGSTGGVTRYVIQTARLLYIPDTFNITDPDIPSFTCVKR